MQSQGRGALKRAWLCQEGRLHVMGPELPSQHFYVRWLCCQGFKGFGKYLEGAKVTKLGMKLSKLKQPQSKQQQQLQHVPQLQTATRATSKNLELRT